MATIEPRVHRLRDGLTLTVRSAHQDDAPRILDYVEAISRESDFLSFGPGEFGMTDATERAALREFTDRSNRLALLGFVEDALISMLTFSGGPRPRTRHVGEFGLSVRRSFWGQGVAGQMLDSLIEWAKTDGVVTKINLRVRTDNTRAIELYRRKGFVTEGTLSNDLSIDGESFDHHMMGLAIRTDRP